MAYSLPVVEITSNEKKILDAEKSMVILSAFTSYGTHRIPFLDYLIGLVLSLGRHNRRTDAEVYGSKYKIDSFAG